MIPAQTHTATAHAVEYTGAKAKLIDIDFESGNLKLEEIKLNELRENANTCPIDSDRRSLIFHHPPVKPPPSPPPPSPPPPHPPPPAPPRIDPLAQTFMVNDDSGVFVTKIDVFFHIKDDNIPVFCQLREVELGTPTQKVLAYSEITLEPNQVVCL